MLPFEKTPKTVTEKETLVGVLNELRAVMLWKLDGLDREQASRPMVPSGTSLLGIVKHLAWVERWWFVDFIGGEKLDYPWSEEDPDADFRVEDHETIGATFLALGARPHDRRNRAPRRARRHRP